MASRLRKRRKKSEGAEDLDISDGKSIFILGLPVNVILEVFSYLTKKELCITCRVCRTWRRIASDNRMWRHVDMMDYPLPLAKMWKVIRAHFSDALLTLRLSGFLAIGCATKWKRATISNAMLDELRERCPNIRELCLCRMNLNTSKGVESKRFPPKLKVLKVTKSQVPCCMSWLSGREKDPFLPDLEELDFSYSSAVNVHTLADFGPRNSLRSLKLNGCYRLTGSLYEKILDNFPNLVVLEMSETGVTDDMLHHLCRTLTKLERLNLSQVCEITDSGVLCIPTGLKKLNYLDLSQCNKLTMGGFKALAKLSLSYLNVAGNELSDVEVSILQGSLGEQCKVVHTEHNVVDVQNESEDN